MKWFRSCDELHCKPKRMKWFKYYDIVTIVLMIYTVGPRQIGPIGAQEFLSLSQDHL